MTTKTSCAALLLLALGACASPERRLERMFAELRADNEAVIANDEDQLELARRQHERLVEVRELTREGRIESAQAHFEAAMILVGSDETKDLEGAEKHGREAARLGRDVGLRVAAEAIDKLQVKRGLHQRYGTQYAYDVARKRWMLYPVDPHTTDAERKAMGVPGIAEIRAGEGELNRRPPPR